MAVPSFLLTRLNNLESHLNEANELLAELENDLELADNTLAKRRRLKEIEHITSLTQKWETEYNELSARINRAGAADVSTRARVNSVGNTLGEVQRQIVQVNLIVHQDNSLTLGNRYEVAGNLDMGNNFTNSGTISNSNINVGSTLAGVASLIGTLPNIAPPAKDELNRLVEQLKTVLAKLPDSHKAEAAVVAERTQDLVREAARTKPGPAALQNWGEELQEAAKKVEKVLPEVPGLAEKIVTFFTGLPT